MLVGAWGACAPGTSAGEETTFDPIGDEIAFRGAANLSQLDRAEVRQYIADMNYIKSLAPRGSAVGINHADPRQHRFAMTRMRLAGKTPENAPELFRQMEALRTAHLARGLTAGAFAPSRADALVDGPTSQHESITAQYERESGMMIAGALGSRTGQLSYGYVDSCAWDTDGNLLGDCEFREVYGNMPYSVAQSLGDPAAATAMELEADSFLGETLASTGEFYQSYVVAAPQIISPATSLTIPTVEHPVDSDGNGATVVCLDRTWTHDCEYNNTGMWTLKVPLKGSLSVVGTGMTIDWGLIHNTYQSDAGPWPGRVFATLGTSGGGCSLPAGGADSSMQRFWKQVTVAPATDPTTLSWDLYSDSRYWADFSSSCRLVQDTVYVTIEIAIPYVNTLTGARGTLPVTITNAPTQRPLPPPNRQFSPALRVTNSCLAEGTVVAGADGAARKIEELRIGDAVTSPFASSLTITDTAVGTERSPMVRIADARGRELMMTELHPLYVVDRGMVAARELRIGDRVRTDDGTSVLVRVTRESYGGKVYNLKVGTPEEALALGPDQTAVYANGFLVGDGQIQSRLETLAQQPTSGAAAKLSMRWHQDYLTSRRNAR